MKLAGLFACLLLIPSLVPARTWRVRVDGSGDAPTIQAAIDSAAVEGDLVLVEPGTYYENLDFLGKAIRLISTSGPAVTTIDGSNEATSVVLFVSETGASSTLEGFTVTGGRGCWFRWEPCLGFGELAGEGDNRAGGGVYIKGDAPTIRNNVFRHNVADKFGGAIAMAGGCDLLVSLDVVIEDNLFVENVSHINGGAIAAGGVNLILRRNIFRNNKTGPGDGGAVWYVGYFSGRATITDNQFWENEAHDHGGAIEVSIDHTATTIERNLFVRNMASGLDDPTYDNGTGGAISARPAFGSIRYNTFVDNDGDEAGTGGAILVSHTLAQTFSIEQNIFAGSLGYAIRCNNLDFPDLESGLKVSNNLFWNNTPGDVDDRALCLDAWVPDNFFGDPLFCGADADNFTVSKDSPALTNGTPMGTFWDPGCGAGVPVEETTWGKIKALYYDEP